MTDDRRDPLSDAYVRDDGWVSMPLGDGEDGGVHMRVKRGPDGRLVVTDLYLHSTRVAADLLRSVQPARIEAMFNLFDAERRAANESGNSVPVTAALFAVDAINVGRSDESVTLGELRERRHKGTGVTFRGPGADHHLSRPDGTDPDGFYRTVAEAYLHHASVSPRPAVEIALDAEVPVNTARGWIKEARRRGFLPSGKRRPPA